MNEIDTIRKAMDGVITARNAIREFHAEGGMESSRMALEMANGLIDWLLLRLHNAEREIAALGVIRSRDD